MGKIYGIDIGSAYSTIACIGHTGAPEIIADNEMGKDNLASAVYFYEDGTVNVGDTAKEVGYENPDRLCQYFRRWLGSSYDSNRERYLVDGREYDPIELTSIVLKHMIRYAWDSGEDVRDVVITCPAYFYYSQRDALKQACIASGLNVLAIANEPVAAVVNHLHNRKSADQTILVYDLGGTTFNATLLKSHCVGSELKIETLGADNNVFLGGYKWDDELYQLLLAKYEDEYGNEAEDELKALIRGHVEDIKKKLTTRDNAKTRIAYYGEIIKMEVSREEFEKATAGYAHNTVSVIDSLLKKVGVTDADIDVVLAVGGASKMPMIRAMLSGRFGEKVFFDEPEKAIAKGAVIIGDKLMKNKSTFDGHLCQVTNSFTYVLDESNDDSDAEQTFYDDLTEEKKLEQIFEEFKMHNGLWVEDMLPEANLLMDEDAKLESSVSEVEPEKPKKDEEIDYLTYREYIPKDRPIGLKVSVYAIADHRISTVVDFIYPESKPAAPVKDAVLLGSMEIETEYYMSMDDVHISYAENGDVCVRLKGSGAKYRLHVCRDEWKALRNELHNSRF